MSINIELVTKRPWTLLKQQDGEWAIECAETGEIVARGLSGSDARFIVHIVNSYKN